MEKLEYGGGCPKSKTICGEGSDNEFLLADKTAAYSDDMEYELNTTKEMSSRRSSTIEESSDCDFKL